MVQYINPMRFLMVSKRGEIPKSENDVVFLKIDMWNDFSFVTMFRMVYRDSVGELHEIGDVKIGYKGQAHEDPTFKRLPNEFNELDDTFFSLGERIDYYKNLLKIPLEVRMKILKSIRDVALLPDIIEEIKNEDVFGISLLRDTSLSVVRGKFARVIFGKAELTGFDFSYTREGTEKFGEISLGFEIKVNTKPSTNIHAIIGRNGAGKTTILNGIIRTITEKSGNEKIIDNETLDDEGIKSDYFSSLVSASFSAFDPFYPPQEQPDPAKGTCYFYIGLKDAKSQERHLTIEDLQEDCIKSLMRCFYNVDKRKRWENAMETLGSDENFSSMGLGHLYKIYTDLKQNDLESLQSDSLKFRSDYLNLIRPMLSEMSSGHAVVFHTMTKLVATVEEKTLVLLDEPESHLHPPLLSAFVRALSDLLYDQNGVGIIATHSPVVLQEIPKSCVWKINRIGTSVKANRPKRETFGENVGILTSEVFGLEVERSGFHSLLASSVDSGKDFDEIVREYDDQLGIEGLAILRAMVSSRDRSDRID